MQQWVATESSNTWAAEWVNEGMNEWMHSEFATQQQQQQYIIMQAYLHICLCVYRLLFIWYVRVCVYKTSVATIKIVLKQ